MSDLLFAILFATPLVALALHRDRDGAAFLKVGCANVMMLFYIIADHIGLLWLYLAEGGVAQLAVVNRNTVVQLALYSNVVVLAYFATARMFGVGARCRRLPDLGSLRIERYRTSMFVALALIGLPVVVAKIMAGSPLLLLLAGDPIGAAEARLSAATTPQWFLGIKPSYLDVMFVVLNYASTTALVMLFARRRWKYFWLWLLTFVCVALNSFSNTAKGFVLLPLLGVWFSYALLYRRGNLMNKSLLWVGVGGVIGVAAFARWAMGNATIDLMFPVERLVLGNLLPQYIVVDRFGLGNLLHGTTVPSWMSFGVHRQFLLDVYAWRELMGGGGQLFYTAPSSFVAEAHANFHFWGVAVASFIVFAGLRAVDRALQRIRSEVTFASLTVFLSLYFSSIARSGMVSFLVDYALWAVLLFATYSYRIVIARKAGRAAASPAIAMAPTFTAQ